MAQTTKRVVKPNTTSLEHDVTVLCGRDKSLTHRAVMFASLAPGQSRINFPLLGADCLSTISCFQALGVTIAVITEGDGCIHVTSPGPQGFRTPTISLDCGNSGTTARLMTGILSAIPGLNATLIGDASLSQRPMDRIANPLRELGAQISGQGAKCFLPLTVSGAALKPMAIKADKASAQIKSAVILAGLLTPGETGISLPKGGRDHTEKMLKVMGANIQTSAHGTMETIRVMGPFLPPPATYSIPVDPSSAAFLAVLGLLRKGGQVRLPEVLDNPTRTGFIPVLCRMNPHTIQFTRSASAGFVEDVGLLTVSGGQIYQGTDISPEEVPSLIDEIPVLAVAAAFAETPSRFRGLGELRVKESDRLVKTHELLRAAGAEARLEGDDLIIMGGLVKAKPFHYETLEDHRLTMAATIMAQRASGPCTLTHPECVAVSFPHFFSVIDRHFAVTP